MSIQRKKFFVIPAAVMVIFMAVAIQSSEKYGELRVQTFSSEHEAISPNQDAVQDKTAVVVSYEVSQKLLNSHKESNKNHTLALLGFFHVVTKDNSTAASHDYFNASFEGQAVNWRLDWSADKIPDGEYSLKAGGVAGTLQTKGANLLPAAKPILNALISSPRYCLPDLGRRHQGHLRLKVKTKRKSPAKIEVDIQVNSENKKGNQEFEKSISQEIARAQKIMQSVASDGEWNLAIRGCTPLTTYSGLQIDRVAPEIKIVKPAERWATNKKELFVSSTWSDDRTGIVPKSATFSLNSKNEIKNCGAKTEGLTCEDVPIPKEGTWPLQISVVDRAGNRGSIKSTFLADYTAPRVAISGPANKGTFKDMSLALKGRAGDAFSGLEKVWFEVDGKSHQVTPGPHVAYVPAGQWPEGKHRWRLHARDQAGNVSVTAARVFTLDYSGGAERTISASTGGGMTLSIKPSEGYASKTVNVLAPAGALKSDIQLSITPSENAIHPGMLLPIVVAGGKNQYYARLGNTYDFGPDGTVFQSEVDVIMSYSPEELKRLGVSAENLTLATFDEKRKIWVALPSVVDEKRQVVTGKAKHFSIISTVVTVLTGGGGGSSGALSPAASQLLTTLNNAGVPTNITNLLATVCAEPFISYTASVAATCYNNPDIKNRSEVIKALELVRSIRMSPSRLDKISIKYCGTLGDSAKGMVPLPEMVLVNDSYKSANKKDFAKLLAHEFYHIQQIRDKGFQVFACEYSAQILAGNGTGKGNALEKPAYEQGEEAGFRLNVCDWDGAQTPVHHGVKNNQCLPSCGATGGTASFSTPCSNHSMLDAGAAYDVPFCCRSHCDRATHPAPHWGDKNNQCLPSCGQVGGTASFSTPCDKNNMKDAGVAYDVPYCCKSHCDRATHPAPHWGDKNNQCLPSCGQAGGTASFSTPCNKNNMQDAGVAYDVPYCCKPLCDPVTQPAPHYGPKGGVCRGSCGAIGGTASFSTSCDKNNMKDAGVAYDVPYCCKSHCNRATHPAPHWGDKNNQCLPSCGQAGGTASFNTPCSRHNMADAGIAYDVPYCCKSLCDPVTQPAPHYGPKGGVCRGSCGAIGGTASFSTPCSRHNMADAGIAYDVPYCCKSLCDPATQPAPHYGPKGGVCRGSCGAIGGTRAFNEPCSQHGMTDAGIAYDVKYCCK